MCQEILREKISVWIQTRGNGKSAWGYDGWNIWQHSGKRPRGALGQLPSQLSSPPKETEILLCLSSENCICFSKWYTRPYVCRRNICLSRPFTWAQRQQLWLTGLVLCGEKNQLRVFFSSCFNVLYPYNFLCLSSIMSAQHSFNLIYALARGCLTLSRVKKVEEQAWVTFLSHLEDMHDGFQTYC